MRYALLVLEQPWSSIAHDPQQTSVRHFLEGLGRLHDLPTYYATYFDGQSFDVALQHLLAARNLDNVDKVIVYVAGHGRGSRLGGDFGRAMNLKTLFARLRKYGHGKIAGLILDSCQLGMNRSTLRAGMTTAHLAWLLAYGANMDWLSSMLINLHVLQHMAQIKPKHLTDRDVVLGQLQAGLSLFNPWHIVDRLDDDNAEIDEAAIDELLNEASDIFVDEDALPKAVDSEPGADDDICDGDIDLSEGITVVLRCHQANGRYRREIVPAEALWPAYLGEDELEDEAA